MIYRHFMKIDNELRSHRQSDQMDTPSAVVGVFVDDEQLMRLFARVYELGRNDARRDICASLGVRP